MSTVSEQEQRNQAAQNPLEVIEQITYLLFIRRLDELQALAEALNVMRWLSKIL